MKHVKAIIVILFLLVVVIVAGQNYQALIDPVSFKVNLVFFKKTADLPVSLIAVIALLIGVFCIWVYGISERLDFRRQIKMLMKDVKDKEQELNSLRNLPVTSRGMDSDPHSVNT